VPAIPFVEVSANTGTVEPMQMDWKLPKLNVGFKIGFTVTVYVNGSTHCPAGLVNVYVPLDWLLTTGGFHVPVNALSEVGGKSGTIPPAQMLRVLPILN
jgi:hypothetical protein